MIRLMISRRPLLTGVIIGVAGTIYISKKVKKLVDGRITIIQLVLDDVEGVEEEEKVVEETKES